MHRLKALSPVILLAGMLLSSCEKNPIDTAFEEALDFSGFFQASDGTEIELRTSGRADVVTVGSAQLGTPLQVGNPYMTGMGPTGTPGEYRGYAVGRTGMLDWADVQLTGNSLVIRRKAADEIAAHVNWSRISSPSTLPPSSPPPGGDGDTTPAPATEVLLDQNNLKGDEGSSAYFTITVPAGVRRLVVETSENQGGYNVGDLFVSRGQQPKVNSRAPYSYSATCASVKPNRQRENCTFDNPPAGEWHILLYGYHRYYGTRLTATIHR